MEAHSHLPRHFPSDGEKATEWIIQERWFWSFKNGEIT